MIIFAHVSDTHFGEVLANSRKGAVLHQDPHALVLCLNLPTSLDNVRAFHGMAQQSPLPIVHSGDLTLCGAPEEFAVAHAFMRSRPRIRRMKLGGSMGLDASEDNLAIAPGNHDHWRGLRGHLNYATGMPGYTAAIMGRDFRPTPWVKTWHPHNQDVDALSLELFGVDSSSGLAPNRGSWLAKGKISAPELKELEHLLKRSYERHRAATVRVVICHHSLSYRSGGLWRSSELDNDSRDELLRLCATYHVTSILTGHTHDFHWQQFPCQDADGSPWVVNELRCASTLATNHPAQRNGFWIHRIGVESGAGRTWRAWRHSWNGSRFVATRAATVKFAAF